MSNERRVDDRKLRRGAAREAAMREGGPASWRGRSAIFKDRRKEASRTACRGGRSRPDKEDAE